MIRYWQEIGILKGIREEERGREKRQERERERTKERKEGKVGEEVVHRRTALIETWQWVFEVFHV